MTGYEEVIADLPLSRGYATAGTDTGHTGLPFPARWALDDLRAVEDDAYRAVHRTAEISKRLIAAYYSAPAHRSFFRLLDRWSPGTDIRATIPRGF